MKKQHFYIPWVTHLILLPMLLLACGQHGFLTNKERVELRSIITRATTAKKQFKNPSLHSAQTVLEVIQDAKPFIRASVKKAPPPHLENLVKAEAAWEKQALETMEIGKTREMQPFYRHLRETIHLTLELLKKIRAIDNQA